MTSLKKLIELLSPDERRRAGLLTGMIVVMALLDALGVASILPFMAVLANPQLVDTNLFLRALFEISTDLGVETRVQFLFFLGVGVFGMLIVSLAFKALTTYLQIRFAQMREASIGKRLIEGYLYQPYSWFLNRHSADLGKTILSEVNNAIVYGMLPLMTLIAQVAVALALLLLLIIVDPLLTLVAGLVLGVAYSIIFRATSGWLTRLGDARITANQERYTAVIEAFGAAKEVKVGGLEEAYVQRFASPADIYARGTAIASTIGQLPRFLLEAVAFGGMLLIILYLIASKGSFSDALPVVALYAFAGYRLLPALQQVYTAMTQLRFASPAIEALHAGLTSLQASDRPLADLTPMSLASGITLDGVVYRYPKSTQSVLQGLSLTIPARGTIGLVGTSGSGKTTTVDVVLGLLEPQEGSLSVDGQPITAANRRQWQRAIGYVPQQIYLADDSIAANIAFGVRKKYIDPSSVERAAKIANLHKFVVDELPRGYETTVGERGVRLSGGQRQRIGIARALYHSPQVLILDEATSALDSMTEQAVMDAVNNLGHEITIILIAHRLSTVRQCDKIYLLERGRIKASGTYDELVASSSQFAAMARKA